MSATASEGLGYQDFQGFARWYNNTRRRLKGREASPATTRGKMVWAAAAANVVGCKDEVSLGQLMSERQAVEHIIQRFEARLTPGALRQVVYALRNFGEYSIAMGWIERHEVRAEDLPPKNPVKSISVYSQDEMEMFVSASRGYDLRWWALVTFLVDTGRRIGETLGMTWEQFRLDVAPPHVELPMTKNGESQYVPLTRRLVEEVFTPENIIRLKNSPGSRAGNRGTKEWGFLRDPALYPFPFGYHTAQHRMETFCRRTGLPNRGFHNFRHSVITHRLAAGMPMHVVSKLAGHRNIQTTVTRYDHTSSLAFSDYIWEAKDK